MMKFGACAPLRLAAAFLLLLFITNNPEKIKATWRSCENGNQTQLSAGFRSFWSQTVHGSNSSGLGIYSDPITDGGDISAGGSSEQQKLELGPVRVVGEVAEEVIVRFTDYKYASVHKKELEGFLDGKGWEWIERVNPASAFPTDFGLLRVKTGLKALILAQLARASFVKDVSPEMQFTRALTSEAALDETKNTDLPHHGRYACTSEVCEADFQTAEARTREMWHPFTPSTDDEVQRMLLGRLSTQMSFEDGWDADVELSSHDSTVHSGRKLLSQKSKLTSLFGAEKLWAKGFTGSKVKMAVFDTGVRADHPHFRNIMERTDWTNDGNLNDNLGHGTFVAGVISSQDPQCLGFAPDAEIYAFRVFTDAQVSYTSWFLDAFNYAIATAMNVLNLSIGGPDYLDRPFVEKVWEMTANKIIMVSAIGNDGPFYGTLNNPADQSDVIGVGGIDYNDHIAVFSSRGMTTWEIPHGYGRVKPDVVAYGREVIGSRITSGCKSLSGTSVASPVVAGAVCLLASVIPEDVRWDVLNPASMKQALVEGAARLDGPNMFEQGAGRLNLLASYDVLVNYKPRASVFPSKLDFTDCPYAWPFCHQPMYAGAMPVIFNATILNGMGVSGYIEGGPKWVPAGDAGNLLDVHFTYSDFIWPWTGYLGLHMRVKSEGSHFRGIIEGNVIFTVVSPPGKAEKLPRRCDCRLPVRVQVIPTPPRERRILWDQFHSIRYPPGYVPRDSLDVRNDILDWHGDHLHTNFHGMFDNLRDAGYYVEILGSPFTCFDANQYGSLLLVDLEDEYFPEEVEKLKDDVELHGLGLIVFADWYNVDTMIKMKFFDDNTRSWWTPATGGANVPALNDLLAPFGIAFGDTILNGPYSIGGERIHFASGTDIIRFPAGGFVHRFLFQDTLTVGSGTRTAVRPQVEFPILGAVQFGKGRITAYGDSNCLDSSHNLSNCYWLLRKLLNFTSQNYHDLLIFAPANELVFPLGGPETILPARREDVNLTKYSLVLDHELQCGMDAPQEVQNSRGYVLPDVRSKNRVITEQAHLPDTTFHRHGGDASLLGNLPNEGLDVNASLSVDGFVPAEKSSSSDKIVDGTESTATLDQDEGKTVEKRHSKPLNDSKEEVHRPFGDEHNLQLDMNLLLLQWVVRTVLCTAGFLVLVMSLWRVRQRKRRRGRGEHGRRL